ncbi:MAG: RHS repeat-associated core domain-containing protein, partial [Acidobacteria bacterium]|nr:RHS repeat-associated core domain-containing protein [Acidobacteriota bacterium]
GSDQQMDTADDITLSASAFGNFHFFTGREFDSESGLYYYRRRYYDPGTGRFVSADPLGIVAGPNLYTYAGSVGKPPLQSLTETNLYLYTGNNPINRTDPFGLYWGEDQVDWWLSESVVPGPYGQPRSAWGSEGPTSWGDPMQYTEAAGGAWMWAERAAVGTAAAATTCAVGWSAVQRGGWLNANRYLRIGFGQHRGRLVFRAAGEWVERLLGKSHWDIWTGGSL